MNRRTFVRSLGLALAGAALTPQVAFSTQKLPVSTSYDCLSYEELKLRMLGEHKRNLERAFLFNK